MHPDTQAFLEALFAPCEQGFLTFTAIHPDGQHPTPSRHVPVGDLACLTRTVERLTEANQQGWGAYVAIATRKTNLGRWRRGGLDDLLALPALFVDVDDPSPDTLARLQTVRPTPSCITFTTGGFHAYWWLRTSLTDFDLARHLLHALAAKLGGDRLSPAQSLRLPQTRNTKPQRGNALCKIVVLRDVRYTLADFDLPSEHPPLRRCCTRPSPVARYARSNRALNPALIAAVADNLIEQGYRRSGDWLSGPCLFPQNHHHADTHTSFGFNVRTGYGNCFRCNSILLKDICQTLMIHPSDYGGLFTQDS
ncbi:MAG: RepB family DNA primase [Anaerolineae bacterium]|nr:RepB family DNA primase [Anaerolineae bacterium]